MTEEQAWLIFLCEPAILLMFALIYIGAKKAVTPPDDATGRTPSMPAGTQPFRPDSKLKPYKKSPDMLLPTDESDKEE